MTGSSVSLHRNENRRSAYSVYPVLKTSEVQAGIAPNPKGAKSMYIACVWRDRSRTNASFYWCFFFQNFYLLGCKPMLKKRAGKCGLSLGKLRTRSQNFPTLIPSDLRDHLAMSSEAGFSLP